MLIIVLFVQILFLIFFMEKRTCNAILLVKEMLLEVFMMYRDMDQQIENFFARNPRQLISLNFFWKMWDCWQPCMPMDCSFKF